MKNSILTLCLRHPVCTLLAAMAPLWIGLSNHALWAPDELRVGGIGREMWEQSSWAVPLLSGEAFLEQPPFYWWVQLALYEICGQTGTGIARAASSLLASAVLLLVYWLGRSHFSRSGALLGALVFSTTMLVYITSRKVIVDNALLLGTAGSMACFGHILAPEPQDVKRAGKAILFAGFYIFLAIAFFSKGLIGLCIPGLGMAGFLAWSGKWRRFLGWHLAWGPLFLAGLIGLWVYFLWRAGGEAHLRTFFLDNHWGRMFPDGDYDLGHREAWWFYLRRLPLDLLPWTPFLALAAPGLWKLQRPGRSLAEGGGPPGGGAPGSGGGFSDREREGIRMLLSFSVPIILALSCLGTKRGLYLLPVYPPLALLLGVWMDACAETASWEKIFTPICRIGLIFFGLGAAILPIYYEASAWPGAAAGGALVLALAAICSAAARRREPRWKHLAALLTAAAGLAAAGVTYFPIADLQKSYLPRIQHIAGAVPAPETIHALRPTEAIQGGMSFYAGRPLKIIDSPEELRALVFLGKSVWLLLEDDCRRPTDFNLARSAGLDYSVVLEAPLGSRRIVRLLQFGY